MLVACIDEDECKSEHVNNFSSLTWTYFLCPHRNVGIPDHCHRRRWSHLRKQRQDRLQHSPRAAFLHRRPQNWYAKTSLSTNNLFYRHFEMPSTVEGCTWIFSDCSCELVRSHQRVSHSTIIGCRKHRCIFSVKQLSGSQRNSQFIALPYVEINWWVLTLLRAFHTCCFHLWSDVVFHRDWGEKPLPTSTKMRLLSQGLQLSIKGICMLFQTELRLRNLHWNSNKSCGKCGKSINLHWGQWIWMVFFGDLVHGTLNYSHKARVDKQIIFIILSTHDWNVESVAPYDPDYTVLWRLEKTQTVAYLLWCTARLQCIS